jgi:hypothetical protein
MKKLISKSAATGNKLRLARQTLRVLRAPELLQAVAGDTRWPCNTTTTNDADKPG